jgi:hypothetical protein
MDDNFTLRNGKYAGKTIGWVRQNNPSYLQWLQENQPNMLKPLKTKAPKEINENPTIINNRIQPNMNFDNEGPDTILKRNNNGN